MGELSDPYMIRYPYILAMADRTGERVELVEFFDCIGGAMWVRQHYAKSPLVTGIRNVGSTMRYHLMTGSATLALEGSRFPAGISQVGVDDDEIRVSYIGLGGGGVGAAGCRGNAGGVLRASVDRSGGGREAGSTIWLTRRQRVLIGVDDTDTPDEGATWTLAHNIAREVEDESSRYLSHTIVQLFPVPFRTKNCVAVVCEFASSDPAALVDRFHRLLSHYTLSDKTGMAVYNGFIPSEQLRNYGIAVKRGQVTPVLAESLEDADLHVVMAGRGAVGAIAALPFATQYEEALALWDGRN